MKKFYAVNSSGRQLLKGVGNITDAYELVTTESYWVQNPPKYLQEITTLTFQIEDFEEIS